MNKKNEHAEHEFAFYYPVTSTEVVNAYKAQQLYQIDDKTLCHRITSIVRLAKGESFILFDEQNHAECTIAEANKKIVISCDRVDKNKQLEPSIIFLLPILKREAFQEAIYSLAEMGINEIQPVMTAKMQRQIQFDTEKERLERIMYAAAEQSKHFAVPTINKPLSFDQIPSAIKIQNNCSLFFDPAGHPLADIVDSCKKQTHFTLMIGPEGDLTSEEKSKLKEWGFTFCALTPTILRAQQAAVVAAGIIRSLI